MLFVKNAVQYPVLVRESEFSKDYQFFPIIIFPCGHYPFFIYLLRLIATFLDLNLNISHLETKSVISKLNISVAKALIFFMKILSSKRELLNFQ